MFFSHDNQNKKKEINCSLSYKMTMPPRRHEGILFNIEKHIRDSLRSKVQHISFNLSNNLFIYYFEKKR